MKASIAVKKPLSKTSRLKRARKRVPAAKKSSEPRFHSYPIDPSSPEFTHALMRSFNEARQKAIEGFIAAQSSPAH